MADRIIKFRGQFDASQVLTSLKQIRQQLSSAGVKDSMFTNVDKDIAAAERAMSELLAQAQKGFKNTSEVDAFAKKVEKLDLAFTKINKELEGLNLSENFSDTSKELESIKKEINEIIKKNAKLKEATEALLEPSNKTVFATQEYKKAIQEAIDKQEDLAKALEEVNKKQAESGYNTLKNQFNKLDAEGKATATASILNNQDLSFGKNVSTDFIEKYKKALNEIIVEGKNAKQVFDALGQELSEEDQSYATSAQFVEDYANNLNQAAKAAANAAKLNSGIVSQATTKATAIGGYSVDGTFHAANAVQPVIDYNNAMQQSIVLTQRRATEEQRIIDVAEQAQRDITQGLTNQRNGQQQVIDTQRDQIQATRDQVTAQQGLNDVFDRMSTSVKQLFSIGTALSTVRRVVTETFQDVQKLDKAFGSIAMVTSYSVDEMWQSYGKYAEMAAELGQTTESVIQSSALFYQQGLDTAEALELTEQTMKLATLANADFQTATSQMTAALRGFHMEMTQGAHVTDVYSELAANAAANVNGIAYAMSKTASIASSAGMAFETTAAFLTQMIETTQEAPKLLKAA